MTDRLVPPEFQIRETQVMEHSAPNPDVFYPNNQGSTGWSPLPPRLDRQVGMDPAMSYGMDAAQAASRSGADAVQELLRQTSNNQINTTRVTEREGGSFVTYHEPTRDNQTSSVGGQSITGDPETVQQALLVGDRPTERAPTVEAMQAHSALNRKLQGMNEGTQIAFRELIRQKGGEAIESVSSGLNEAIGSDVIKSTDSGVPWYDQMNGGNPAFIEIREIMRYHGERQRKGAARPVAKYHPSQSNYRSSQGTLSGLDFSTNIEAGIKSGISSAVSSATSSIPSFPDASPTKVYRPILSISDRLRSSTTPIAPSAPSVSPGLVATKAGLMPQYSFLAQQAKSGSDIQAMIDQNAASAGSRASLFPGGATGERAPTAGNGDEDSQAYIGEDGLAYYAEPEAQAGMSKNMKWGLAIAAGVGLLVLLRG